MAMTTREERAPATPNEIWEILRRTAEQQEKNERNWKETERKWREVIVLREREDAKRREEDAKRRTEEAKQRKEDAKRRKEEAQEEAKRREEDAKRRKEEAQEEAKRRAEEALEEAKRREEEAQKDAKREKEWERLSAMLDKTSRRVKENDKTVGGLGRSYGKLVEHLVGPGIIKRFGEHGYHFDDVKKQRHKLYDENGRTETEIDLLLENADTVIAVEVKSRPDREETYLGRHLVRVEIMRAHAKNEGWEGKRILGAIAGAIFDTPVRNATLKAGFFVIEQSGETMRMNLPEGFTPREW